MRDSIYKKLSVMSLTLVLATGCGIGKSNPMDDYKNLEAVPESELSSIEKPEKDKDPIATDWLGQLTLQQGVFQIVQDEALNFTEGEQKSFEFSVKFLRGQAKFDIDVKDRPDNMTVELVDQDINVSKYKVSWNPAKGTLASAIFSSISSLKVSLKDIKYVSTDKKINSETKKIYEKLQLKTADLEYVLRKNDKVPTLVVKGLSDQLKAGEVHKFTVEVTAPSSYTSDEPLIPEISHDVSRVVNSAGLVEANIANLVSIDPDSKKIEKLAKNKWRIFFVLDTKNATLPPQHDRTLRVVNNADELHVNLSFRVVSDKVSVSDKKTIRFTLGIN